MASTLFSPAKDGRVPTLILDGGMGTTLQSYPVAQQLDSNLWSSELLKTKEGRETLEHLHRKWIEAGADIVETCTYQSSLPLFLPPSGPYSPELLSSSLSLMSSAIPLLTSLPAPFTALSLGPFGASLQPGQEYAGLYPPPFGPSPSISPSHIASGQEAFNAIPLPLKEFTRTPSEATPEDHLASWHLLRLRHFHSTSPVEFSKLSFLAFETVPLLIEAVAIRRAMTRFRSETNSNIPFYISYVFPLVDKDSPEEQERRKEGIKFPDSSLSHLELSDQAPLIIQATFSTSSSSSNSNSCLVPADGIGFNCTSPLHSLSLTQTLTSAYSSFSSSLSSNPPQSKPFFILYPDGGAVYSVETRSWSHPLGLTDEKWAEIVTDSMEAAREGGVWSGVVGGGCCKAGVGAIGALRRETERRGWR